MLLAAGIVMSAECLALQLEAHRPRLAGLEHDLLEALEQAQRPRALGHRLVDIKLYHLLAVAIPLIGHVDGDLGGGPVQAAG